MSPLVLRARAQRDIDDAVEHYRSEGGARAAVGFIDALERAFGRIALHPRIGATRYAQMLNLPGLRSWPVQRYPYVIFYREDGSRSGSMIDVWRLLHSRRDLPAEIRPPSD